MSFTDLPPEVVLWILSQRCVPDKTAFHFLFCRKTAAPARYRLVSNRPILIKCQDEVVLLETQYAFGMYGKVPENSTSSLECHLDLLVRPVPRCSALYTLTHTSCVTINVCFDDENTEAVAEKLAALASLLRRSRPKKVLLQVTAACSSHQLALLALEALSSVSQTNQFSCSAIFHLLPCLLPAFLRGISRMDLFSVNIQSLGHEALQEKVEVQTNGKLREFKLSCNFRIPNMCFRCSEPSALTHLELDFPIEAQDPFVQNADIMALSGLQDLRLFNLTGLECVKAMMHRGCLPNLESLYMSFQDVVVQGDFDFHRLAPKLEFLYLSDKRTTITKRL